MQDLILKQLELCKHMKEGKYGALKLLVQTIDWLMWEDDEIYRNFWHDLKCKAVDELMEA